METGDNCIIIRPVENQGDEGPKRMTLEEQIAMLFAEEPAPTAEKKGKGKIKNAGRR